MRRGLRPEVRAEHRLQAQVAHQRRRRQIGGGLGDDRVHAHHLVERRVSVLVSDADVWFARNPFPLLRDPGGALWRHAIVANVEGAEFPGVNGGLAYFRGDDDDEDFVDDDDDLGTKRVLLRRTASAFLLGLFDAHVDELLRLDPAPTCRDGKTPVRGALMDQDVLRDAITVAVSEGEGKLDEPVDVGGLRLGVRRRVCARMCSKVPAKFWKLIW